MMHQTEEGYTCILDNIMGTNENHTGQNNAAHGNLQSQLFYKSNVGDKT
jgi:hypothetical protein